MSKLVLAALVLTVILTMPFTSADALTATCLPSPLPATPTPPTYPIGHVRPTLRKPICVLDIMIVQAGIQRSAALATPTSSSYCCETLAVPTTVVLVSIGPEADAVDEPAAFTLLSRGFSLVIWHADGRFTRPARQVPKES